MWGCCVWEVKRINEIRLYVKVVIDGVRTMFFVVRGVLVQGESW